MEYLQYCRTQRVFLKIRCSFKPYYKWNTFNTYGLSLEIGSSENVLNLIINGIPSILEICL